MSRDTLLPTLLLGALIAVGCAPEPAENEMAETEEAPATETMAAENDLSCFLRGATPAEARQRQSPLRELRFFYPGGEALLCYGAPSARDREIMGALVPYGEPWRAGANEPTTIHLTERTSIGGVALEPGGYSLYTIPGENEWRFFLNSSYERWGIPIDEAVRGTEVGSFTVTPEATEEMVETLTYRYADGEIVMEWENTRLRIPVGSAAM